MDAIEFFFFEWLQIDLRQFDVSTMKCYPKELKELMKCVKTEHMLNAAFASDMIKWKKKRIHNIFHYIFIHLSFTYPGSSHN